MSVDVKSDKLGSLVDENVEVEQLGTGFTFTEGPIWNPAGQFLLFSDMPGDTRRRWDEQSGVEVIASPSNKGNGMTLDADGRLIVCEHSTSSLVRMDPGRQEHEPRGAGLALRGPGAEQPERRVRQVATGRSGSPTRGTGACPSSASSASASSAGRASSGSRPDGGDPELVVDKDEYEQPNGLCFSPDESLLYINDTPKALDQGLRRRTRTARSRTAGMFFEGIGSGRDRGGHPRRDEVRRAGEHLGHRPGRRLGDQRRRRAPRHGPDPRERRQPRPGAAPTGARCSSRARPRCTRVKTKVGPRREPYMS